MVRRVLACALAAAFAASGMVAAEQIRLTKRDADSLQQKLLLINGNASARAPRPSLRTTTISEREVNAYLRYHAQDELPTGVLEPYVWILGDGRLAGRAVVDLDAVRKQKPRGWTDPAGYLTGRLPVQATGVLTARDGVGRFNLETAEVSGVTVPKWLLQEIVTYYTRNPMLPEGFSLESPFELPAAIREVKVARGQATIVQ